MPLSKQELMPKARAKYARGLSPDEIAASLGVSVRTVKRWRKAGADAGADWDEQRDAERARDPRAILRAIESRLEKLAAPKDKKEGAEGEKEMPPATWFDAMMKGINSLEKAYDLYGDLDMKMNAIEGLVAWATEHASLDDFATLQRLVPAYLADLKRGSL